MDLVISPDSGMNVVDCLITGWHQPDSSHFAMLDAVAATVSLPDSYAAAFEAGHWRHAFRDLHLILSRGSS